MHDPQFPVGSTQALFVWQFSRTIIWTLSSLSFNKWKRKKNMNLAIKMEWWKLWKKENLDLTIMTNFWSWSIGVHTKSYKLVDHWLYMNWTYKSTCLSQISMSALKSTTAVNMLIATIPLDPTTAHAERDIVEMDTPARRLVKTVPLRRWSTTIWYWPVE